jgi:hypothetical protein
VAPVFSDSSALTVVMAARAIRGEPKKGGTIAAHDGAEA